MTGGTNMEKNKIPLSLHVNMDDFIPATDAEKEYMVQMRPSTTFFKDGKATTQVGAIKLDNQK